MKNFVKKHYGKLFFAKVLTGLAVFSALAMYATSPTLSTVKIVRLDGRSGGSGVILESTATESKVLTNGHVCEVVKNGGLVVTTRGESHSVTSYLMSDVHDLCIIKVSANLKANTKLASFAPRVYEPATVTGHPKLYPNVVTTGHFSGNKVIAVVTGFRPCQAEDFNNPNKFLYCMLFSAYPVIRNYETVLVTAAIMPGSSGSGVYNSNKELSGLVFAGSGDLGYAFIVPYEYVYNFVNDLNSNLPFKYQKPNYEINLDDNNLESQKIIRHKINVVCNTTDDPRAINVCSALKRDYIWNE